MCWPVAATAPASSPFRMSSRMRLWPVIMPSRQSWLATVRSSRNQCTCMRMLDQLPYRRSWWAARKILSWKFTSSWAATCSVILRFIPARRSARDCSRACRSDSSRRRMAKPNGQLLDHRPQAVDLTEVRHRELHHGGAAVPRQRHQALPLQDEERIAHRTPADLQRLGDLLLPQVLARRQLRVEDGLTEPLGHAAPPRGEG